MIFLRSVLIGRWSPIVQRLPAIDAIGVLPDLRLIFRVITVDDQVEIEISSVRNGHGSVSVVERIALAAAERDGVGLLLPHGVEGDVAIHGIHIAGLIAGGGGACRRAPAEEGVALAGGDGFAQLLRKTVGLGLGGDGSRICGVGAAVQVILNVIGLGRQLAEQDGILSDRGAKVELSTAGRIVRGFVVPAVKLIALALGGNARFGRRIASCDALREGLAAQRDRKGHVVVRDRAFHDLDPLRAGDAGDGVAVAGRGLLYAVDVHCNIVTRIRRNGKGVVVAIDDAGRLLIGSCRGDGAGRGSSGMGRIGDLSVEVTGRHHNGEGLRDKIANGDIQFRGGRVDQILCHGELVIKRDTISGFNTCYRHRNYIG